MDTDSTARPTSVEPAPSAAHRRIIEMSSGRRVALGAATAWPFLYVLLFMIWWGAMFFGTFAHSSAGVGSAAFESSFFVILPLHLFTMLLGFALMGIYAYLIFKRLEVDETQRVVWLLVIIFGSTIGQIVFYVLYIWPGSKTQVVATRA